MRGMGPVFTWDEASRADMLVITKSATAVASGFSTLSSLLLGGGAGDVPLDEGDLAGVRDVLRGRRGPGRPEGQQERAG